MKRINTAYRNEEPISLEDLKNFLQGSIYEEEFIVLTDDKSPDYMQMTEQGDTFVLEVRLHKGNDFRHFRSFWDTAEETTSLFVTFYNNQPLDFEQWEEVTQEFK